MLESYIDNDGAKNGAVALPDRVEQDGTSHVSVLLIRRPASSHMRRSPDQPADTLEDAA